MVCALTIFCRLNCSAYVSIELYVQGNSDAYVSAIVGRLLDKKQQCLCQPLVIFSLGTALLTKSYFMHSLHSKSTTMASIFIVNSYQINFESILMIPDHDGMLNMFKALEASGLRGFLGCESVLYEKELQQFFETALVQGEDITGTVSGKFFSISQAQFARVFELPTEGVNWGKVLFNVLKDMVDKLQRKAKGFAAQIGVLLKSIPAIALGEGVPFPFAKILSMKTVNTYIATNTTIDAREEQGMVGEATEKRKSKSTNKSSSADNTHVKVDIIIEQVLEETLLLGVSEEEHGEQGVDEAAFVDDFAQWLDDFVARNTEPEIVETRNVTIAADSTSPVTVQEMNKAVNSRLVTEENMSIDDLLLQISDDMLLPSISAPEISKIRLGESVSINEVRERDVYLTSLPRISTHDKGKAILEEDEPIRGNPARELVEIICGDIEFLIRIRDQVMVYVVEFFHSFSLNTLSNFDALLALKAKEKIMLEWAETDSLEMAVKRKGYILAKYRELLLRKFLDSHQKFLAPGQPWTATTSQIIDLLSDAHSISLEDLLAQQRAHGLPMEQPCASTAFDSSVDSGAVLAKFYSVAKSTCWVRPMILIDGIWTPLQGPDFWKSGCHLSLFLNQRKMPKPAIEDIFALHVSPVEPVQYWEAAPYLIKTWRWAQVCTDIVRYSIFGCLKPVRELPCTDITVYNLGIERIPVDFLIMFAQVLTTRNVIETLHDRRLTLTRLPTHLGSLGVGIGEIPMHIIRPPPRAAAETFSRNSARAQPRDSLHTRYARLPILGCCFTRGCAMAGRPLAASLAHGDAINGRSRRRAWRDGVAPEVACWPRDRSMLAA
ncbi:pentatricopeptide repeat-containing protein [Dorcoceras hygrometricum]|uniref:Pentatricopeptide repeat-containing protein n=1 Tax=Dorcoceras hygrometricum TaxID=472368 RepID=A0A2Z7C4G8_9LAMI|nr:pentatricopeptide repeat-containing protein [Dorcoceras hygrometricum]